MNSQQSFRSTFTSTNSTVTLHHGGMQSAPGKKSNGRIPLPLPEDNPTHNKAKTMTKILTAIALAFTMTGSIFATDGKITEGSCCDKAKKAAKDCAHPCCVAAAKDSKVCAKCNK
jgi:hypothetical protein